MGKFHTSQSTHYRAFIKNIDYKQHRRIIYSVARENDNQRVENVVV